MTKVPQLELLRAVEGELQSALRSLVDAPTGFAWQPTLQNALRLLEQARASETSFVAVPAVLASLKDIQTLMATCESLIDSGLFFLCGCNAAARESYPGYGPEMPGTSAEAAF